MVAIQTKYLGPTNSRGGRIKAFTESKIQITVPWDHALGVVENHTAAAQALAAKMGWNGRWVGGGTSTGYAFVCVERAWEGAFEIAKQAEEVAQ